MNSKRTYFPPTTPQQRKLLFETWQATGSVVAACDTAHVGRGTFYRWKARFAATGYPGLEQVRGEGARERLWSDADCRGTESDRVARRAS